MAIDVKLVNNNSELGKIFNSTYLKEGDEYIEVGIDKVILSARFEKHYNSIANFEVRDDDVFILAFPKSGSRWTQEMVWLILNNLDFKTAQELQLDTRSPLLELETIFENIPEGYKLQDLVNYASPRCIRSHLQWSLLPKVINSGTKNPKIIVVIRGPEDTCTSYYHQAKVIEGFHGSWNQFCTLFLGGKVPFGPYWTHLLSFWEQRHRSNIMFIKYNEMKTDLLGTIKKVATFLGKDLSINQIKELCIHLSFDNLKKSKGFNMEHLVKGDVNPFLRTGKVGDYKNVMDDEVIEAFGKQKEQYLSGTGITFG
ncbi:hypothetical protein FQR65_LT05356 [Abscondita terminalis]|nr:hypothetical protein FQR65_LT05356 [Abscondita terminalis]